MNVNLSKSQYYRSFYSGNDARNAESRDGMTRGSLMNADTKALTKAITTFSGLFKEEGISGKDLYNAIQAFGDTYNNTLSSSSDSGSHRVDQLVKNIKGLSAKEKKSLEEIGISVKESGKLSVDKEKLASASPNKVKKLFGEDSEFMKQLKPYIRSLGRESSTIDLQA